MAMSMDILVTALLDLSGELSFNGAKSVRTTLYRCLVNFSPLAELANPVLLSEGDRRFSLALGAHPGF